MWNRRTAAVARFFQKSDQGDDAPGVMVNPAFTNCFHRRSRNAFQVSISRAVTDAERRRVKSAYIRSLIVTSSWCVPSHPSCVRATLSRMNCRWRGVRLIANLQMRRRLAMFGVVHSYMAQETVRDAQNMREQQAQTNLEFCGIISANPLGEVLGVATLPVCFV